MKRYSTTSIRAYEPAEDPNGEWVRYEYAAELRLAVRDAEIAEGEYKARITELEEIAEKWEDRHFSAMDNAKESQAQLAEAFQDLLSAVEPYLDSIVCYASTLDEHDGNKVAKMVHDYTDAMQAEGLE